MESGIYEVTKTTSSGLSLGLLSPDFPVSKGGSLRPSCHDNSNGFSRRARNKLSNRDEKHAKGNML